MRTLCGAWIKLCGGRASEADQSEPARSSSTCQTGARSAGSGSGTCAAGDSQLQIAEREEQRRRHQQQRCPRVEAVREHQGTKDDQEDTNGKSHARPDTEVAVLLWRDQTFHARSRGIGVLIRCLHRDASCRVWCRPALTIKMISL